MAISVSSESKLPSTTYGTFSLDISPSQSAQAGNSSTAKEEIKSGIAKVASVVRNILSPQPKIGEEQD